MDHRAARPTTQQRDSSRRPLDGRVLAAERRTAIRRRRLQIRRRVAGLTAGLFASAFLAVYVQLASGHDPALSRKTATTATSTPAVTRKVATSTTTTTPTTSTASTPATSSEGSSSSSSTGSETSSESGSSSASTESSQGASPVTTSQS